MAERDIEQLRDQVRKHLDRAQLREDKLDFQGACESLRGAVACLLEWTQHKFPKPEPDKRLRAIRGEKP